jgi:hypothetical protein
MLDIWGSEGILVAFTALGNSDQYKFWLGCTNVSARAYIGWKHYAG